MILVNSGAFLSISSWFCELTELIFVMIPYISSSQGYPPKRKGLWTCARRLSRDIMLLPAIRKKFSSRNCRLRKSFSTVIILTTNLCRFSICFLHDRQQNGNVKRSEFVEFDGKTSNKCSRYRGIFCRSSVILISLSPHIVSVSLFSASSRVVQYCQLDSIGEIEVFVDRFVLFGK